MGTQLLNVTKKLNTVGLHSYTYPVYIALLSNITGKTQPINVLVDTNLRKRIAENRKKLAPIADTVKLCGRLGISFRGHRDDSRYHHEVGEYSEDVRNNRYSKQQIMSVYSSFLRTKPFPDSMN